MLHFGLQVAQIGDELVGFVGFATGTTAHPAFYGGGPPHVADAYRPARTTAGYGGHFSGAIGGSTDETTGVRIGLGVGHGRGAARSESRVAFVQWGGEVAGQGEVEAA